MAVMITTVYNEIFKRTLKKVRFCRLDVLNAVFYRCGSEYDSTCCHLEIVMKFVMDGDRMLKDGHVQKLDLFYWLRGLKFVKML